MEMNKEALRVLRIKKKSPKCFEAERLLSWMVTKYPMYENQFSALCCFILIKSEASFRRSRLRRILNDDSMHVYARFRAAQEEWDDWIDREKNDYKKRRLKEARRLFSSPTLVSNQQGKLDTSPV